MIKIFDEYYDMNSEYYTEITQDCDYEKVLYFEDSEIEILRRLDPDNFSSYPNKWRLTMMMNRFPLGTMYMFKLPDEWYLVKLKEDKGGDYHHYKCDQLEGLIKLIKDKKKI